MNNISNNYPIIYVTIAINQINNNSMRNYFEKYATLLIHVCPYSKHQATNNTNTCNPQISNVD